MASPSASGRSATPLTVSSSSAPTSTVARSSLGGSDGGGVARRHVTALPGRRTAKNLLEKLRSSVSGSGGSDSSQGPKASSSSSWLADGSSGSREKLATDCFAEGPKAKARSGKAKSTDCTAESPGEAGGLTTVVPQDELLGRVNRLLHDGLHHGGPQHADEGEHDYHVAQGPGQQQHLP